MDRLFLGVLWLRKAAQKHCRSGDVMVSPSELWGVIPLVHDAALDLAGATLGAARRITCMGRNVLHRVRRCMWWLVLLPLL